MRNNNELPASYSYITREGPKMLDACYSNLWRLGIGPRLSVIAVNNSCLRPSGSYPRDVSTLFCTFWKSCDKIPFSIKSETVFHLKKA